MAEAVNAPAWTRVRRFFENVFMVVKLTALMAR
jgi:hypothetical protein